MAVPYLTNIGERQFIQTSHHISEKIKLALILQEDSLVTLTIIQVNGVSRQKQPGMRKKNTA